MMHSDWLFDAVQVEVAYRTEQLHKAGRSKWVGRAGRFGRRIRAQKAGAVVVPAQQQRECELVTPAPEHTRQG